VRFDSVVADGNREMASGGRSGEGTLYIFKWLDDKVEIDEGNVGRYGYQVGLLVQIRPAARGIVEK